MSQEHFIKNIEIKNFKLFKDFKAQGFGRVNLIGGKNNVGKTAFMEACYIFKNGTTISSFAYALANINAMRYKIDNIINIINGSTYSPLDDINKFDSMHISDSNYEVRLNVTNKSGQLLLKITSETEQAKINKKLLELGKTDNIYFIDTNIVESRVLKKLYATVQLLEEENYLNNLLNKFDNNIEKFKFINDDPMIKMKDIKEFIHLNEVGQGTKQFIHYIIALYTMKGKILFIDEIANGIHYLNLDKLWEIILKISKELNVQVFATTHSKECIESYARVAKKLEDEDITFIELGRDKENKIRAIVRDAERFYRDLEVGNEVRGW